MTIRTYRQFARSCARNGRPLHNAAARRALRPVHFEINRRADLAAEIAANAVGGKVGFVRSGMDCDCTQYRYESVIDAPTSLAKWVRDEDEARSWLDGPESTWFTRPDEARDGYAASADRALEAFEDGHPGTVHWGDLS